MRFFGGAGPFLVVRIAVLVGVRDQTMGLGRELVMISTLSRRLASVG